MELQTFFKYVEIDYQSPTPKYLQLANSITRAVRDGMLKKNDTLPSINELNLNIEVSRDTAEKAYKHLKNSGLLGSVPKKAYFIKSSKVVQKYKVLLLFNKLSAHKKIIYDSFVESLDNQAEIDFFIYNNDFKQFKNLIESADTDYTHYVIIGHFLEGCQESYKVINGIPKEKLILLDKLIEGVDGSYAAVYENFEKDIYTALEKALPQLEKYTGINLIFPEHSYFPKEIIDGFTRFCKQYEFCATVIHDILQHDLKAGEVFIALMEDDIVALVERLLLTDLEIGKDVGVISYNETPIKKIILNGLTTLSTDFKEMGQLAAKMILKNEHRHMEVPFSLILRPSL